jgi:hypothetical protein
MVHIYSCGLGIICFRQVPYLKMKGPNLVDHQDHSVHFLKTDS